MGHNAGVEVANDVLVLADIIPGCNNEGPNNEEEPDNNEHPNNEEKSDNLRIDNDSLSGSTPSTSVELSELVHQSSELLQPQSLSPLAPGIKFHAEPSRYPLPFHLALDLTFELRDVSG